MMLRLKTCIATLYILFMACSSASKQAPPGTGYLRAAALHPFGRTMINDHQTLDLVASASHIGFSFEGTECRVYASVPSWLDHNYLQYELDGVYQKRVRIASNSTAPLVITAPGTGTHSVWIYKATEAQTGAMTIDSIAGTNLTALQRPEAPLIEFIGNSITCGALADPSEVPCGQGVYHDQHNAYMAYGPRVARALGVNFLVNSVSGIGMYRNSNDDGPAMPQLYEKTDLQAQSTHIWNFATYKPNIVSIALGTNDISKGDGQRPRQPFDSAKFVQTYIQFIQLVKSKYGDVQVALLGSPILSGSDSVLLQNCLMAVKQQTDAANPSAKPVAVHIFKYMQMHGCSYHPSVEDHAAMAEELVPFFKGLLQQ